MVAVRLADAALSPRIPYMPGWEPLICLPRAIRFRDVALGVSIAPSVAEPGAPLLGCGSDCLDVRANEVRKQERSRARAGPAQGRLGCNQGEREGRSGPYIMPWTAQ